MQSIKQLALPFRYDAAYYPADFIEMPGNREALAWLDAPWPGGRLALWGDSGCGKTHLLHVWTGRSGAALHAGPALSGLPTLPSGGGVAVDDADAALEQPLLHLLNAAQEAGLPVLLAARQPPARWPTRLADLASRLRAVTTVELRPPDEAMQRVLFATLLAARQLIVPEDVQRWLLLRLPREPWALHAAAERLDRVAMAAGRRVTQSVAADILQQSPFNVPLD